mmetsp:Transcript_14332/g.39568  ORF Transcript_14332/g.39568 Transcript_14332/m.39568 type:complete len:255 (+) Transcript_14332:291-1055(+)
MHWKRRHHQYAIIADGGGQGVLDVLGNREALCKGRLEEGNEVFDERQTEGRQGVLRGTQHVAEQLHGTEGLLALANHLPEAWPAGVLHPSGPSLKPVAHQQVFEIQTPDLTALGLEPIDCPRLSDKQRVGHAGKQQRGQRSLRALATQNVQQRAQDPVAPSDHCHTKAGEVDALAVPLGQGQILRHHCVFLGQRRSNKHAQHRKEVLRMARDHACLAYAADCAMEVIQVGTCVGDEPAGRLVAEKPAIKSWYAG